MKQGGVHQRRTRFIKEYILDQNATRAAIAAGYSEKSATLAGHRLITNDKVRAEIDKKNAEVNKKLDLTVERVKLEIARLCYYNTADYFNPDGSAKQISELSEDAARAIAGFEMAELYEGSGEKREKAGYIKKFKLADKVRALEMAGRTLKMFVDKVEHNVGDDVVTLLMEGRARARGK